MRYKTMTRVTDRGIRFPIGGSACPGPRDWQQVPGHVDRSQTKAVADSVQVHARQGDRTSLYWSPPSPAHAKTARLSVTRWTTCGFRGANLEATRRLC
jgi:hypothetical protein